MDGLIDQSIGQSDRKTDRLSLSLWKSLFKKLQISVDSSVSYCWCCQESMSPLVALGSLPAHLMWISTSSLLAAVKLSISWLLNWGRTSMRLGRSLSSFHMETSEQLPWDLGVKDTEEVLLIQWTVVTLNIWRRSDKCGCISKKWIKYWLLQYWENVYFFDSNFESETCMLCGFTTLKEIFQAFIYNL